MLKDGLIVLKIHVHLWSKKWAIFRETERVIWEENCFIVAPSTNSHFLRALHSNTHFYELLREIAAATLQFLRLLLFFQVILRLSTITNKKTAGGAMKTPLSDYMERFRCYFLLRTNGVYYNVCRQELILHTLIAVYFLLISHILQLYRKTSSIYCARRRYDVLSLQAHHDHSHLQWEYLLHFLHHTSLSYKYRVKELLNEK